ncbi:MAG: hypothetical protein ABI625_12330, partial [bacterium]
MDKRAAGLGVLGLIAIATSPLTRIGRGTDGIANARPAVAQAQSAAPGTDLFIKPDSGRARSGAQLLR